jgi:hypothetical protein
MGTPCAGAEIHLDGAQLLTAEAPSKRRGQIPEEILQEWIARRRVTPEFYNLRHGENCAK